MLVLVRTMGMFAMLVIVRGTGWDMKIVMSMRAVIVGVRVGMRMLMSMRVGVRMRMHEIAMPVDVLVGMRMGVRMPVFMIMAVGIIMSVRMDAALLWIVHGVTPPVLEPRPGLRAYRSPSSDRPELKAPMWRRRSQR